MEIADYQASHLIGNGTITAAQIASGVVPPLGSATPLVESGSGAAGTATNSSHEDHVHPAAGGGGASGSAPIQTKATGAGTNTNALAVVLGTTPTNGNLLIAMIDRDATGAITSISQTNVTWTQLVTSGTGTAPVVEVWKGVVGAGAGTTLTINCGTTTFTGAVVAEFAGITGTLDTSAVISGHATVDQLGPYTPTIVPTNANALVVGACSTTSNSTRYRTLIGMVQFVDSMITGSTVAAGYCFPGKVPTMGTAPGTNNSIFSGVAVSLT